MRTSGILFAAMLLAVPTSAFAARGIVTTEVSMRAGPGTGFPVVDRIPGGARVTIHGCLRPPSWCDVSWDGERGWVSADRLEYFYRNRFVYLPDYAEVIEYPVVPFVLGSYWASHYAGRPFYHRRAYWNGYWQSQGRLAARTLPSGGSRRGALTQERGSRAGFADIRDRRVSPDRNLRGAGVGPERFAHGQRTFGVNGARDHQTRAAIPGGREPLAAGAHGNRFSTPPMNRPAARADVGPGRGAPLQGHGQFGGARSMGAMPAHGGANRLSGGPVSAPAAAPHVGHVGGPPLQAHGQVGGPVGGAHAMGGMPHAGGAARMGGAAPAPGAAPAAGPHGGGPGHRH